MLLVLGWGGCHTSTRGCWSPRAVMLRWIWMGGPLPPGASVWIWVWLFPLFPIPIWIPRGKGQDTGLFKRSPAILKTRPVWGMPDRRSTPWFSHFLAPLNHLFQNLPLEILRPGVPGPKFENIAVEEMSSHREHASELPHRLVNTQIVGSSPRVSDPVSLE